MNLSFSKIFKKLGTKRLNAYYFNKELDFSYVFTYNTPTMAKKLTALQKTVRRSKESGSVA